jgi:hypothetical protein
VIDCAPATSAELRITTVAVAGPVPDAVTLPVPSVVAPSVNVTVPVTGRFGVVLLLAATFTVKLAIAPAIVAFALADTVAPVEILFTISTIAAVVLAP